MENCMTFFHFINEEWICLWTSNIIERLNKEFKCRTKSMKIITGERSCFIPLTFIYLRIELR